MAIPAYARIAILGDSITAGTNGPAWYTGLAGLIRTYYTRASRPTVAYATCSAPAGVTTYDWGSPCWATFGVAAETLNEFAARLSTIYAAFGSRGPTHVIIQGGINDVTSSHPDAQCQTELTTLNTGLRANCPNLASDGVFLLPGICNGEKWASSVPPAFSGNTNDAAISSKNAALQTTCTSLGIQMIDVRAALALYESTHNTPEPGASTGIVTVDGKHPNSTGVTQIGTAMYAALSFTG